MTSKTEDSKGGSVKCLLEGLWVVGGLLILCFCITSLSEAFLLILVLFFVSYGLWSGVYFSYRFLLGSFTIMAFVSVYYFFIMVAFLFMLWVFESLSLFFSSEDMGLGGFKGLIGLMVFLLLGLCESMVVVFFSFSFVVWYFLLFVLDLDKVNSSLVSFLILGDIIGKFVFVLSLLLGLKDIIVFSLIFKTATGFLVAVEMGLSGFSVKDLLSWSVLVKMSYFMFFYSYPEVLMEGVTGLEGALFGILIFYLLSCKGSSDLQLLGGALLLEVVLFIVALGVSYVLAFVWVFSNFFLLKGVEWGNSLCLLSVFGFPFSILFILKIILISFSFMLGTILFVELIFLSSLVGGKGLVLISNVY
uniref:hypothetical protein n=1 Tax=Sphaeromyxa zaharoni TaxID=275449 RepID=UPI0030025E13